MKKEIMNEKRYTVLDLTTNTIIRDYSEAWMGKLLAKRLNSVYDYRRFTVSRQIIKNVSMSS